MIEPAIAVQQVSDNFFRTLGLRMAIGTSESSAPGAVISYRFWKRRFGGGSNVLGETFDVNGSSYSVIGVAPASFLGVQVEVRLFVNPGNLQSVQRCTPGRVRRKDGTDQGRGPMNHSVMQPAQLFLHGIHKRF